MARGHSNTAIARSLVVTTRSVEKHINSIFAKLAVGQQAGVHPRVQAVLAYLAAAGSR
jgi:DNA-binding NarL/FixJ family response regulator